jgi:hypothetical protein
MDLDTITIERDAAAEQLEQYRSIKHPTEEDKAIVAGLLAAAAGKGLVNLRDVIIAGGVNELGFPRLAVCRSDAEWCYLSVSGSWRTNAERSWIIGPYTVTFSAVQRSRQDGRTSPRSFHTFRSVPWESAASVDRRLRSQVPMIPPALRPPVSRLRDFVTLWEVDEWAEAPAPPGDPALLRHVTGELYSVEATWDLTPLERAVLGARQ